MITYIPLRRRTRDRLDPTERYALIAGVALLATLDPHAPIPAALLALAAAINAFPAPHRRA